MVKVYYTRLDPVPDDPKELTALQRESARKMLKKALQKNGFDPETPLLKTEKGKPYFDGIPLYVSISHDGETVVTAISDHEIGVDTEKVGGVGDKALLRFVGKTSRSEIGKTRLWTEYEALGKYLGCGIPLPKTAARDGVAFCHFKRRDFDICVCFSGAESPLLEKM